MVDDAFVEKRTNDDMRQMFDRLKQVAEEAGRIGGERGAELALQKLFDLTPYDGEDKGQREELRKTIAHADYLRKMCDDFKRISTKTAFGIISRILLLATLVGIAYMLGVKINLPTGG